MTRTKEENAAYMREYRKRKKQEDKKRAKEIEYVERSRLRELRQRIEFGGKLTENELEEKEGLEKLYNPEYFEYEDKDNFYEGLSREDRMLLMYSQVNPPMDKRKLEGEALERVKGGESALVFNRNSKKTTYVDIQGNPIEKEEKSEKEKWGKIVWRNNK